MRAEAGVVVWSTVVGIAISIVLATVLVVRKKPYQRIRADSVQYVFTATVKTSAPRVTYLDFPAPPPPNHDREDAGHGPTVLRTFGRTLTKLRFRYVLKPSPFMLPLTSYPSDKVDVNPNPGDAASSAPRQRPHGHPSTLQITPITNAPCTPDALLPCSPVPPRSPLPCLGVSTERAAARPDTSHREPTTGTSISHPESTPGSNPPHHESAHCVVTVRRDPTPGPSNSCRDPTPGPGITPRANASADRPSSLPDTDGGPSNPCALAGVRSSSDSSAADVSILTQNSVLSLRTS